MKPMTQSLMGKRLSVTWLDPIGSVGGELSDMELAECVSEGKLVKLDRKSFVLASSIYTDSKQGDFTCIHRALVTDWKII